MRVLFLAPYVPFPITHGGRNRVAGLLLCLSRFAEVRVLAAGDPRAADAGESRERLAALGVSLDVFGPEGPGPAEADGADVGRPPDALAHFRCPGLREALPRVLAAFPPDLVHCEELVMAQYADALPAPRVLSRQKVEWAFHRALAAAGGSDAQAHRREAERFLGFERRVAGRFARVLTVAQGDADLLASIHAKDRITVLPLGVDDAIRRPPDRTADVRHVVLYGTLDYAPNVEANDFYFREVWPLLADRLPHLRTLVVGSGTPPASLPRGDPRVELRGYVPDVAAVLAGAGVLVVPLRVGGGARTKILEALAAGMPVVSTAVGVEDLGLEDGRHYLRAEGAGDMAAAVARLASDPGLAGTLGRAGAAHVDGRFRWDVIGRALASIDTALVAGSSLPRASPSPRRVLLVGVRPLPGETEPRGLSFPGHRTDQLAAAVQGAGLRLETVLLDEEPGMPLAPGHGAGTAHALAAETFRAGVELQRIHDAVRPDAVVSAGGYHAARVVSQLATGSPRYLDLAGDLAAEGQLRAAQAGDGVLHDYLSVLVRALLSGDRFSVVGPSQRLVVLGQLGLLGRLTAAQAGDDLVDVLPLSARGPQDAPALPPAPRLRVLWSGGYNAWMDVPTVFAGIEQAMARSDGIELVATGGPIPGHDEDSHRRFWTLVRGSAFSGRFHDRGRLARSAALEVLDGAHVVLAISAPSLEAETGSRQRLVEALAHGRPVVATRLGDLAGDVEAADAGLTIPPGDAPALAEALVRLAADRPWLEAAARRARRLWETRFTPEEASAPLRAWLENPRQAPSARGPEHAFADLAADRLRLQAQLDAIRASRTFRTLRLLDRLLGRGGGPAR
jgi:glycosyltransferase involved in cell wall biosynthesis